MKIYKNKKTYIKHIFIAILLGINFISIVNNSNIALANPLEILATNIESGYKENVSNNTENTRNLIKNFCNALENTEAIKIKIDKNKEIPGQLYKHKESLFVYFLCQSAGSTTEFKKNFSQKEWLKKNTLMSLNLLKHRTYQLNCNPENTVMNSCKIWEYYPQIMKIILNDYFNIIQAQILSAEQINQTLEERATLFSKRYFPNDEKKSICRLKRYTNTCSILKEYLLQAKKTAENTVIIDIEKLTKNCNKKENNDTIFCKLVDKDSASTQNFTNLLYNELFWYTLFFDYYRIYTINNPSKYVLGKEDTASIIKQRIEKYNNTNKKIYEATKIAYKSLENFRFSFPLHIGLLLYQETLTHLRNATGNMYSPIRTLYDKFINVQS